MNGIGNTFRLLLAVVVIFILLSIALPDIFPTVCNMQSMAFQASEIGILAIAITVTMISGGIDLSIVSTANVAGIIAGLAVDIACGLSNGYLIAVIWMPPILPTLGTMLIYKGISTGITKGTTIFGVVQSQFIGNGSILQIPFPLIILILIAIIMSIVLGRTRFGLRLYMMGSNPSAARFSGNNNRRVLIIVYVICHKWRSGFGSWYPFLGSDKCCERRLWRFICAPCHSYSSIGECRPIRWFRDSNGSNARARSPSISLGRF
jgi:simple sugar transport system permease protein